MKIAVVGSINIDQSVETDRIPRKGETIAGQSLKYTPGGKGANQAVAMGRLGAEVVFFGCVGDDANGKAMLENLESQGVSTTHIQTIENVPTGIALITVGDDDNTIIIVSGANHYVDKPYIDKIKHYLTEFDLVVLQNEIPKETNLYVIDFCNRIIFLYFLTRHQSKGWIWILLKRLLILHQMSMKQNYFFRQMIMRN